MDNDIQEEKKAQIRRRKVFELRGKNRFVLISASPKIVVAVPNERNEPANYLFVFALSSDPSELPIRVEGHTHPISALDFAHQDHSKFASASTDGEIRVWKANDSGVVHLLSSRCIFSSVISQLHFHHSKDALILSSSPNERLLVWDWMTNKILFAVAEESSIAVWSIDSRSIFTGSSTQLQVRDSLSGRVLSSSPLSPYQGSPYKMLAITTNSLLVMSEKHGSSILSIYDTASLNCVHNLQFDDSLYITPFFCSNLGILTLVHKSDNSMESHQFFDCSPYLRSHISRRILISSQCTSHDWTTMSSPIGHIENESSISCLICLPSTGLNNDDEELVSVLHTPSSSPALFLSTIRHAPVDRAGENGVEKSEETEEGEDAHSSSKNQVSSLPLDCPSTQSQSSSIPHTGSNNQLTFSRKWNFLSQVTQADYRSKEEEEEEGNLGTTSDINQGIDEKTTIESETRNVVIEEESEREDNSLVVQGPSSIGCLSELVEDSLQSPSRSLSLQSTEISWYENGESQVSNGTANMTTVTMGEEEEEGEGESLNGKESRASYANMDRFILEETVSNLEIMLRKSERDRFRMQKRMEEMERDISSLRYENEWSRSRISELERLLSVQSSAQ